MLKDLLEYLAKSLVDNPDEVHVEATETDTTVVLELSVAKDEPRGVSAFPLSATAGNLEAQLAFSSGRFGLPPVANG